MCEFEKQLAVGPTRFFKLDLSSFPQWWKVSFLCGCARVRIPGTEALLMLLAHGSRAVTGLLLLLLLCTVRLLARKSGPETRSIRLLYCSSFQRCDVGQPASQRVRAGGTTHAACTFRRRKAAGGRRKTLISISGVERERDFCVCFWFPSKNFCRCVTPGTSPLFSAAAS